MIQKFEISRTAAPTAVLLLSLFPWCSVNAQTTVVETERSSTYPAPRVIDQRVLFQSRSTLNPRYETDSMLPKRSNYSKRLGDMLEQISFAYQRGWLSGKQYDDLKNWEASVAIEELVLRQNGNGIVPLENIEQLERHMNGLAYSINQEIADGSRLASGSENTF